MQSITLNRSTVSSINFSDLVNKIVPEEFRSGYIESLCATPSRTIIDVKHPTLDKRFEIRIEDPPSSGVGSKNLRG